MARTTRREILKAAGLTAGVAMAASPFWGWAQAEDRMLAPRLAGKGKRVLFFTKSQGFPHPLVTRKAKADGTPGDELAIAEKLVKEWGEKAGYAVEISKEGSIFTAEKIATFDAFIFYTSGDLTKPPLAKISPGAKTSSDMTSPMTEEGKAAFLKAIADGKGFIGLHSGADTFEDPAHKMDPPKLITKETKIDPYCEMLGAEFTSHGAQQKATMRVASKTFPGLGDLKEFEATEEWYAFTNFSPELHVILVHDTTTMKIDEKIGKREKQYQGEPYPETWAKMHGKGRVFYTGMGHREDIWANPVYQKLFLAALAWTTGVVQGEVPANVKDVCPGIVGVK